MFRNNKAYRKCLRDNGTLMNFRNYKGTHKCLRMIKGHSSMFRNKKLHSHMLNWVQQLLTGPHTEGPEGLHRLMRQPGENQLPAKKERSCGIKLLFYQIPHAAVQHNKKQLQVEFLISLNANISH